MDINSKPILGIRVEVSYTEALVKMVEWTRNSDRSEKVKKEIIEHAEKILHLIGQEPIVGKVQAKTPKPFFKGGKD